MKTLKVKIQDEKLKLIRGKGMHLLNNFILKNEIAEITLKKEEEFILGYPEFSHWFETVETLPAGNEEPPKRKPLPVDEPAQEAAQDSGEFVATKDHSIKELRDHCKTSGFKNYTQLSKGDLISAINEGKLQSK